MNVSDVLDQAIELGVGFDNVDTDERALYLKHLNMAAEELYSATASLDEKRSQSYIAVAFDESGNIELLDSNNNPVDVLSVSKVITKKAEQFKEIPVAIVREKKFLGQETCPIFCYRDNLFTLYSNLTKPYDVFIAYTPAFNGFEWDESAKKEKPVDLNTLFRKEWHRLLVYGTLYYIYQDIDGFKSSVKESIAASEWKRGIASYSASLFNSYPDVYVPYTRV